MHREVVAEHARDLASLGQQLRERTFGVAEMKYAAQRAYNVHRGKGLYEEKLRRKQT